MPRYSTKLKPKPKPKKSMLPVWLSLAGMVLFLFSGWLVFSSNQSKSANIEVKGAPRLKVEQDRIDRGDVKLGTPISDAIRVTNIGDQPLRFTEAPYAEVVEGC